ncbi:MAG: hypothetical protein GF350_03420 [Chitinivibrionales bacterium]|nr:hypothetical protein [Chitinivibrionales bacterium]
MIDTCLCAVSFERFDGRWGYGEADRMQDAGIMIKTTGNTIARHYTEMQITTAPLPKAICMLHDKCILYIHKALENPKHSRELLNRSQNILAQLQSSLQQKDSTSRSIFLLYDYCYVQLEQGTESECSNVLEILHPLSDAFFDLVNQP